MIAEQNARGKRLGWESMLLMLKYGQQYLKCDRFIAKIGYSNTKSIQMFEKMKFKEVSRSEVFQEITFEVPVTPNWVSWLDENIEYTIHVYQP